MERPAKPCSQQGVLLVEAVLSAVVMAVGLVFISRGLSQQLKALRSIEEYDVSASLAQNKLLELEGKRLAGRPLTAQDQGGAFARPHEGYRWAVVAVEREAPRDANGEPLTTRVTITVQRSDLSASALMLSAIWPAAWVPDSW